MIGRLLYLWYRRRLAGLPSCIKSLAVAWYKDLTNLINESSTTSVQLIDFDGVNDYVDIPGTSVDATGNKKLSFYVYLTTDTFPTSAPFTPLLTIGISSSNNIIVAFDGTNMVIGAGSANTGIFDITGRDNEILFIEIEKSTGSLDAVYFNSVEQISSGAHPTIGGYGYNGYIGRDTGGNYFDSGYIWDVSLYDTTSGEVLTDRWLGYPNGSLDSAWKNIAGTDDGTVEGSPSTFSLDIPMTSGQIQDAIGTRTDTVYYGQYLDATSGQINLYRATGTYDYTDPSDGSRSEDNAIPGDGLITVPANGICDIGVNRDGTWDGTNHSIYENFYPVVERAGTVLHDILEDSKHVSVATPSWSETLYGSDYLNQCGFSDKELYDQLGITWESTVNGSAITLDDDCLVPVAKWNYQFVFDSEGEQFFDSEGEPIRVRVNI